MSFRMASPRGFWLGILPREFADGWVDWRLNLFLATSTVHRPTSKTQAQEKHPAPGGERTASWLMIAKAGVLPGYSLTITDATTWEPHPKPGSNITGTQQGHSKKGLCFQKENWPLASTSWLAPKNLWLSAKHWLFFL